MIQAQLQSLKEVNEEVKAKEGKEVEKGTQTEGEEEGITTPRAGGKEGQEGNNNAEGRRAGEGNTD